MPGAKYTLVYRKSVAKDLQNITKTIRLVIVKKILALAIDSRPSNSVKLRGAKDLYRIRHNDYRIIYQIEKGELIILIIKIGHRREVHRK